MFTLVTRTHCCLLCQSHSLRRYWSHARAVGLSYQNGALLRTLLSFITTRKRSLRRLCFYTCLSFILFTGGKYLTGTPWTRYTPPRPGTPTRTKYTPLPRPGTLPRTRYTHPQDQVHPPGPGTPPAPGTPPGTRYGPGTPPGAEHAGRYGQRAGGPHPTGMQSCFYEKRNLTQWTCLHVQQWKL